MDNNVIMWARVNEDVKIPTKRDSDAGYDIYAYFKEDYLIIHPHETVIVPTGLYSAMSEDWYFQLEERGSTGTKGMSQRCGVIDSSYRGEWMVPITNVNEKAVVIIKKETEHRCPFFDRNDVIFYPYEKAICQAVLLPVPKMKSVEIPLEELKVIPSERGEGKIGSSGK